MFCILAKNFVVYQSNRKMKVVAAITIFYCNYIFNFSNIIINLINFTRQSVYRPILWLIIWVCRVSFGHGLFIFYLAIKKDSGLWLHALQNCM